MASVDCSLQGARCQTFEARQGPSRLFCTNSRTQFESFAFFEDLLSKPGVSMISLSWAHAAVWEKLTSPQPLQGKTSSLSAPGLSMKSSMTACGLVLKVCCVCSRRLGHVVCQFDFSSQRRIGINSRGGESKLNHAVTSDKASAVDVAEMARRAR